MDKTATSNYRSQKFHQHRAGLYKVQYLVIISPQSCQNKEFANQVVKTTYPLIARKVSPPPPPITIEHQDHNLDDVKIDDALN